MVFSHTTTWVFQAGPVIGLASVILAALLIPFGHHSPPISFAGDIILFIYLLALGRFFTAAAALDTGSSFEGMGAAREVTFACFAEPALILGLLAMGKITGSFSLGKIFSGNFPGGWTHVAAPLLLITASWMIVILAENCRIPFDDPNTHLELTMIHEVMILDHSGPALGMILYGAAIKLLTTCALVVNILYPQFGIHPILDWMGFLMAMILLSVIIGLIESNMARLKLINIPRLLVAACLLSAFSIILLIR
jgi:formate hydrogenlyase subunit 4